MEDYQIELSIIIPYFNGTSTIISCLDSIYSQGLENSTFEVICVDDCSTDLTSVVAIEDYKYDYAHPTNLILIRHKVNKRQGGARNTGIKAAKGKWILFIDQDDFFIDQAVCHALDAANRNPQLDFIMFDCVYGDGIKSFREGVYSKLNQNLMSGNDFLQHQPVPWSPWCYMYNRKSLRESGLRFTENVRFEDVDFVLQYTAFSKLARFYPLVLVYHVVHEEEQSYIGNNKNKIRDLLKIEYRIAVAAENEKKKDLKTGQAMMNHAIVHRYTALKRYLWRLPYKDIRIFLQDYHYPCDSGNALVNFTNRHFNMTAFILTTLKPLFYTVVTIKKLVNS